MDFEDLVDPLHTVLLLVECQNGVIGPDSSLPALAEAAAGGLGPALGELASLVVTDIAGRSANEAGNRMSLHEL